MHASSCFLSKITQPNHLFYSSGFCWFSLQLLHTSFCLSCYHQFCCWSEHSFHLWGLIKSLHPLQHVIVNFCFSRRHNNKCTICFSQFFVFRWKSVGKVFDGNFGHSFLFRLLSLWTWSLAGRGDEIHRPDHGGQSPGTLHFNGFHMELKM